MNKILIIILLLTSSIAIWGKQSVTYDLAKEINGQAVATEIARHELYGCTGAEMVQEMKTVSH